MTTITVEIHPLPGPLPDADTDCLLFVSGEPEAQLGAYVGHEDDGSIIWAGTHGQVVGPVVAWCEMPRLPGNREALATVLRNGKSVDLAAPWRMPT